MKESTKKKLKLILKLSIGVFLLILLITRIQIKDIINSFKDLNWNYFICGACCFLGIILVQALRHFVLLKPFSLSYPVTLKLVLMGFFFNNLLPTHIGGDIYKIFYLRKRNISLGEAAALITLDRITALGVILFSGLSVIIIQFDYLANIIQEKQIPFYINTRIGLIALLLLIPLIIFLFFCIKSDYIFSKLKTECAAAIHILKKMPYFQYMKIILLSLVTFILRIFKFYFFILCLKESIPLANLIIVVLMVNIFPLLPVSIGGLGVLEGTLFLGLTFFGVSETVAVSAALINRFTAWILALSGGILYLGNYGKFKK